MKEKIAIVEDQILTAERIAAELKDQQYEVTAIFDSGEGILKSLQSDLPDIIIMDIILNGELDGIETSKRINQKYRIPIIYLTDLKAKDYFDRAKETFPKNFLIKPFQPHQLIRAVELALNKSQLNRQPDFTEKYGFFHTKKNGIEKVAFDNIKYLEADGQYCKIVLANGTTFNTSYPMKEVFKKIPYQDIIRVSRSYCINLNDIDTLIGNQIKLGNKSITIGDTYRDEIKTLLNIF